MARLGTYRKFSEEFKRSAVERMQTADSISDLAEELGLRRNLLYKWEGKLKRGKQPERAPAAAENRTPSQTEQLLKEEIKQLREALGKRSMEVDFFKGALQKIAARQPSKDGSGGTAFTSKSGK